MTDRRPPASLLRHVASDLRPVNPTPAPWRRTAIWAPLAVLFFAAVPLSLGARRDLVAIGPWIGWGLSAAQVVLGIWLVWMNARDGTPSRRLPSLYVRAALIVALAAAVVVTFSTNLVSPTRLPPNLSPGEAGIFCYRGSLAVGAPLLFLAGWIAGRGWPLRPWLSGALLGAGAALSADAAWRLVCPVSDPWHVISGHGSTVLTLVLVGAVGSEVLARWTGRRHRR